MHSILLIVTTLVIVSSFQVEASIFQFNKCPKVEPMADIDINKMSGAWYQLVAARGVLAEGDSCFKTTIKIIDSENLQYLYESQTGNVSKPMTTVNRTIDPNCPGIISHHKEYDIKNIFGQKEKKQLRVNSYILYTDYTNIELRYSCTELDHFWHSDVDQYFYITVRNRSFDSIKQILPLLGKARELGFDLNDIQFPAQQSCISS